MKKRIVLLTAALLSLGGCALTQKPCPDQNEHSHSHAASDSLQKQQTEWGIAGTPEAVTRTIHISMTDDMRFTPEKIEVKHGDVVNFVLKNDGKVLHEFVLGTKPFLDELAVLVEHSPEKVEHDRADRAHAEPNETRELFWHFNRPGNFDFACLLPGHYSAGMVGTINVVSSADEMKQ